MRIFEYQLGTINKKTKMKPTEILTWLNSVLDKPIPKIVADHLIINIGSSQEKSENHSKHNPKNKEEAYCHQLEHDLKLCFSMSQMIHRKDDFEKKKLFQDALNTIKIRIESYEQTKYS